MKIKFNCWAKIIWLLIFLGAISCLMSCHSAKYHFDKFIEKGGQVECPTALDDSIRDINIIMPPPKWQMRLENKRLNDSLDAVVSLAKIQSKEAVRVNKAKERTEKTKAKEDGKTDRTDLKQTGNTNRTGIRQSQKTNRSLFNWWKWLLFGYFLNPIIRFLYRKARDGFIRLF